MQKVILTKLNILLDLVCLGRKHIAAKLFSSRYNQMIDGMTCLALVAMSNENISEVKMSAHKKGSHKDEECENPTDAMVSIILVIISIASLVVMIAVSICLMLI